MAEYIERNDLINNRPPQRNPDQSGKMAYNKGYNDGIKAVLLRIENQPTADVAPVRHGHWITKMFYTYCSACDNLAKYDNYGQQIESDYCPSCGAKMDKED